MDLQGVSSKNTTQLQLLRHASHNDIRGRRDLEAAALFVLGLVQRERHGCGRDGADGGCGTEAWGMDKGKCVNI